MGLNLYATNRLAFQALSRVMPSLFPIKESDRAPPQSFFAVQTLARCAHRASRLPAYPTLYKGDM